MQIPKRAVYDLNRSFSSRNSTKKILEMRLDMICVCAERIVLLNVAGLNELHKYTLESLEIEQHASTYVPQRTSI